MRRLTVALLALCILFTSVPEVKAAEFSEFQQKKVDQIVKIVSKEKNWEEYGSLPSVCIAQAYVESGVGIAGRKNNLWGLNGGRASYKSLKKGTYAYMECINKSYYTRYGATDTKNWKKQIRAILKGGYCVPASGYFNEVSRVIKKYDLKKYDKKMFKEIKKARKERKAKARAKARAKAKAEREKKEKQEKQEKLRKQKEFAKLMPSLVSDCIVTISKLIICGGGEKDEEEQAAGTTK